MLGYGEGQTTSVVDLAKFEVAGTAPASFTNQAALYNAVITGQPRNDKDLSNYYKSSDFSVPTGDDVGSVEHPAAGVTVIRDKRFQVPHIYASTRSAGMYAAGYVSAQDRLFLMDVLRRTAEGEQAGLLGPSAIAADSAQLGQFDLSPAELTKEINAVAKQEGKSGQQALSDLNQYVAGINGYINATKTNPTLLPAEYVALGATPRAWTLADTAAEAYLLIAQFTGEGEAQVGDVGVARIAGRGALEARHVHADQGGGREMVGRLLERLARAALGRRFAGVQVARRCVELEAVVGVFFH